MLYPAVARNAMRIKRFDISGFKSFCDPVKIILDQPVTAVVGPNGCGKSNIVDALRWTLGEGSAKALRGSAMEDVIFNGSENRGPKSMAEVTITFDNSDGLSHPDYIEFNEIAVTRRLHRDGTSEYLINKVPCRRRDITDLFLGTGGGARAYSIVEQGRIGLIVSARSEDRRNMIEEAAGITKYKHARRISERRMDQTRQNLLRVSDVVSEMERTLANLNRQAKKAERYKRYRAEQTDLELHTATSRYLKLRAEIMMIGAKLEAQSGLLEDARNALAASETRVQSMRIEEQEARSALDKETALGYEIDNKLKVAETEIRHLLEAIARHNLEQQAAQDQLATAELQKGQIADEQTLLTSRIERVRKELEVAKVRFEEVTAELGTARERLQELGEEHDAKRDEVSRTRSVLAASEAAVTNLNRRIEDIENRLETVQEERDTIDGEAVVLKEKAVTLETRTAEIEQRLDDARSTEAAEREAYDQLKEDVEACEASLQETRDALQTKRSRKASLEEVMDGLKTHDSSVREAVQMLEQEGENLLTGLLVDTLSLDERYEQAAAASLGDRLQTLLVQDRQSGLRILEMLKARDMGRVAVASPEHTLGLDDEIGDVSDPAVLGPLSRFIKSDGTTDELIRGIVKNIFVVSTLEEAERLFTANGGKVAFVTLDGQLLEVGGVMRGGRSKTAGAQLLGQKREIRGLEEEVASLSARYTELEQRFAYLKDELARRLTAAETARTMAQAEEIALAEVRKDSSRTVEDLAAIERRRDAMDRELAHQNQMVVQARADFAQAEQEVASSRMKIEMIEQELQARMGEIEGCRHEVERLSQGAADIRVQKASLDQQLEGAIQRRDQLKLTARDLEERLYMSADKEKKAFADLGRTVGTVFRKRERLAEKIDESERVRQRIDAFRSAVDQAAMRVTESETEVAGQRKNIEQMAKQVSELEMSKRETALAVEHLFGQVEERNDVELLRVIGDYHLRPLPGEDVKARIDELRGLIDRMGAINLAAIEEYEEQSERYKQLTEQKDDLEQALEDLERAIAKMDKDSKRRFKETFEIVNETFKKIFPKLFNGGQAHLELSDPNDLLGTGVDIFAQPPGKKLGSNELLSGGEKALTAVSLLFAIFLHRPSPFCILDEVDAPLDEANVNRFVDMVHQMTDRSQFIFITHSKVTMEKSDALYGITMEEPGISKVVTVNLTNKNFVSGSEGDKGKVTDSVVYA